jgi:hypothetical protein
MSQRVKYTINKGYRLRHKASIKGGLNSNFNTNNNTSSFNALKENRRKRKERAYKA